MRAEDAYFGIEMSSHFFYKNYFYADSGMMTIAYMLKFLSEGMNFEKELDQLEKKYFISGEVNFSTDKLEDIITKLANKFKVGQIDYLDGISIEFPEWRFNLRGSNTQPLIRLNVEARNKEILIEKFKSIEKIIDTSRDNKPLIEELQ